MKLINFFHAKRWVNMVDKLNGYHHQLHYQLTLSSGIINLLNKIEKHSNRYIEINWLEITSQKFVILIGIRIIRFSAIRLRFFLSIFFSSSTAIQREPNRHNTIKSKRRSEKTQRSHTHSHTQYNSFCYIRSEFRMQYILLNVAE